MCSLRISTLNEWMSEWMNSNPGRVESHQSGLAGDKKEAWRTWLVMSPETERQPASSRTSEQSYVGICGSYVGICDRSFGNDIDVDVDVRRCRIANRMDHEIVFEIRFMNAHILCTFMNLIRFEPLSVVWNGFGVIMIICPPICVAPSRRSLSECGYVPHVVERCLFVRNEDA